MAIALDAAVLLVLAFCAWRGSARGCVLTLCGLLAVIVAYGGATWVSRSFSEPIAALIQPYIQTQVEALLVPPSDPQTEEQNSTPSRGILPFANETEEPVPSGTLEDVLDILEQSDVLSALAESTAQAVQNGTVRVVTTAVAAVSSYLATEFARAGLFLIAYVVILLGWWLLSHALDLAFRLPVLRTLNKALGLLLGLVKGALILLVVCWAVHTFNWVPAETANETFLFRFFLNFQAI